MDGEHRLMKSIKVHHRSIPNLHHLHDFNLECQKSCNQDMHRILSGLGRFSRDDHAFANVYQACLDFMCLLPGLKVKESA